MKIEQRVFWVIILLLLHSEMSAQGPIISVRTNGNETSLQFNDLNGRVIREMKLDEINPYKRDAAGNSSVSTNVNVTQSLWSQKHSNSIAVLHTLSVYNEDLASLQDQNECTLEVYDSGGMKIFSERIKHGNANEPILSSNGKFVGICFAGLVHEQQIKYEGLTIFDLTTGQVKYEMNLPNLVAGYLQDDVMIFVTTHPDETETYYVFHSLTGEFFKRNFSKERVRWIKKFTNDGMILLISDGIESLLSYEKHFERVE